MASSTKIEEYTYGNHTIRVLDDTDSTNAYLERLISKGHVDNGFVVTANHQSEGRGQMGTFWRSDTGKNLLFSIFLVPEKLKANRQFYLSKAVSISLIRAMNICYPGGDFRIKWPNDILLNRSKIAGTLIQCGLKGTSIQYAIIGIGLNVNQDDFIGLPGATSLEMAAGKAFDRKTLLEITLEEIDKVLADLEDSRFDLIDETYHNLLFGYGKSVELTAGKETFSATIQEVDPSGKLVVKRDDGEIRSFDLKQVRLDPIQPAD